MRRCLLRAELRVRTPPKASIFNRNEQTSISVITPSKERRVAGIRLRSLRYRLGNVDLKWPMAEVEDATNRNYVTLTFPTLGSNVQMCVNTKGPNC
jgi:hypothetical protein